MALGASRRDVLGMVIREAAALLGIGLVIGAFFAVGAAMTARSLLFGLEPGDPTTLAMAAAGLTIVGLGASLLPARRAASIDPMLALREE
jgi:ABC-type antimicrobial peptide transport system permease subunit